LLRLIEPPSAVNRTPDPARMPLEPESVTLIVPKAAMLALVSGPTNGAPALSEPAVNLTLLPMFVCAVLVEAVTVIEVPDVRRSPAPKEIPPAPAEFKVIVPVVLVKLSLENADRLPVAAIERVDPAVTLAPAMLNAMAPPEMVVAVPDDSVTAPGKPMVPTAKLPAPPVSVRVDPAVTADPVNSVSPVPELMLIAPAPAPNSRAFMVLAPKVLTAPVVESVTLPPLA
jgi:hypothetical protein